MRVRSLVATAATAATIAAGMAAVATPAAATTPTGPVSVVAATWTPSIATSGTDGTIETVRQLVPCGSLMYAVGSFTQITQGGQLYTRNNVFSFNATTGAMTSWAPNITPGNVGHTGSGAVNSIALSADCSTAYLGGVFVGVNGTKVSNIAAVNTTSGALLPTFGHTAAGQVATLVRSGSHLLAGGYFSGINGSTKPYLVSLDLTTGKDDGYLDLGISGNYNYKDAAGRTVGANPTRVWNTTLSPDGSKLLVMGDFMTVAGQHRQQLFMLDLGTNSATLDAWYSPEFNAYCDISEPFYIQDASWAPDMSQIYTVSTGYKPASGTGWRTSDPRAGLCDAAAAFPSTANSNLAHLWVNYTGCDSLFSTAADATTVYIGGHERFANNPRGCDAAGPGAISAPGAAGLSATTGLLNDNMTRARGNGADDELVTSAGLWIGSDNAEDSSNCGQTVSGTPGLNHAGICFLPYASAPVATYTSTCTSLTCFFDASASTAPGSQIASYSWNFGDGTTGTGVNPSHTYAAGQPYTVTLTVTDVSTQSGTSTQTVSPTASATSSLAFVGSASTNGNATAESVTVPAGVTAGNALLLVANGAAGSAMTAPAGWTQVDTASPANGSMASTLWERVATASDAGSTVTVTFPAAYHGTVQLLAYSGTNATDPIAAYAKSAAAMPGMSYPTPTSTVPANGDVVVSVWSTKSSTVNTWTAPAGQTVRSTAYGSGTGRINSIATDGGIASAGPAGGLSANTDASGSSFAAWTIVLAPATGGGGGTPTGPPPASLAFVGSTAADGNATTESVTVPVAVTSGDALLLVATGAAGGAMTAPAGWSQVGTVSPTNPTIVSTLWERVATSADAGSTVTVTFPAAYHGTVQLLAYSGTNATQPIATYASKAQASPATSFTTPTATVPADGDVVVSVWSTKSSTVNAWTAPGGQTVRSTAYGSGAGRINSIATDGGIASAGPAGGLSASTDASGSSFAAWTIVLTP